MKTRILIGALAIVGCTTSSGGLQRREEVRAHSEATRRQRAGQLTDYRSRETIEGARWGMSSEEVRLAVPEATPRGGTLSVIKRDAEAEVIVSYAFSEGQLSQIERSFLTALPPREYDVLRSEMERKHGGAIRAVDTAESARLSQQVAATFAAVGTTLAIGSDVALLLIGAGPGNSTGAASFWLAETEERGRQIASSSQRRQAEWQNSETRVTLVSVNAPGAIGASSAVKITYGSRVLPPPRL